MNKKNLQFDFTGKTVLVTGGARGIGAEISYLFAMAGAHVIINYLPVGRDVDTIGSIKERIEKDNGSCMTYACDISNKNETEIMCNTVLKETGSLDILVNSAGFVQPEKGLKTDENLWRKGIDINLSGAFFVSQSAAKNMLQNKWGRIIYIGSSGAITGGGGSAFYSAAKAGINGLVRFMSKELAPQGITVNAILPAIIDTDMLREREPDSERREKYINRIPVGRLGKPEDVSYMVVFLASDYASYITSQQILVDGGSTY